MVVDAKSHGQGTAVLCSAGLDSAVLLADEARRGSATLVYVRAGLAWEDAERRALDRLLATPPFREVQAIVTLDVNMRDVYTASHWAVRGEAPAFDTPDEDVYLPGRNIVLLAKAGVMAASRGLDRIVLGPLAGNPFPDATPAFLDAMARALSLGLDTRIDVAAPFRDRHKAAVIRQGLDLGVPLELTLSCMSPVGDLHCGRCSKCRERRDAFADAGVTDPTHYASVPRR